MSLSPAEKAAVRQVIELAEIYGFGNLISHLKTAWMKRLLGTYPRLKPVDEAIQTVTLAADVPPYPLDWDWEND